MSTQPVAGPKGSPFLGHLKDFAVDPPTFQNQMAREYGDVVPFRLGNLRFFQLSHPDLVQELLVKKARSFHKMDRDKRVMGKVLGQGLVTSDGDFHKQQRTLSQPSFRKKRIRLFADAMLDETEKLLNTWEDGKVVDINQAMVHLSMFIVTRSLFNVEVREEAEKIGKAIHSLQEMANQEFQSPVQWPEWLPTPLNRRLKRERGTVDAFIENIIKERREQASQGQTDHGDLLSTLIEAADEEGKGMSDEQLRDELVTLFVAGHETTANALTWTWYLLARHPEIEKQLHDEIDAVLQGRPVTPEDIPQLPYVTMVLKESMRLYPPAWTLNGRIAIEDVKIGDVTYPMGTNFFISPYALHRDPRYYHAPESFDPTHFTPENEQKRHRFAYIPFGAGPRVCIGNAFAMMEATLLLTRLAQRYRFQQEVDKEIPHNAYITLVPSEPVMMRMAERKLNLEAKAPVASQDAPTGCPFHQAA